MHRFRFFCWFWATGVQGIVQGVRSGLKCKTVQSVPLLCKAEHKVQLSAGWRFPWCCFASVARCLCTAIRRGCPQLTRCGRLFDEGVTVYGLATAVGLHVKKQGAVVGVQWMKPTVLPGCETFPLMDMKRRRKVFREDCVDGDAAFARRLGRDWDDNFTSRPSSLMAFVAQ